ncbi:MAG: hypothetical protein MI924_09230 [Chloroflexales bacterium]|nr:hypothetical protein [Chloroflexales bacterium]
MPKTAVELYRQYYPDAQYERRGLFALLAEQYQIEAALYPGSFVHITPSFCYPITVYVDTDQRARTFFADPQIHELIASHKTYPQEPVIRFHAASYSERFAEDDANADLLISQYAGFVSQPCKRYLKIGGLLLANNSHGDAGLAAIDPAYRLIGVIQQRNGKYQLSAHELETYFIPKTSAPITREYLESRQKGIGYTKTASVYLFQRVM